MSVCLFSGGTISAAVSSSSLWFSAGLLVIPSCGLPGWALITLPTPAVSRALADLVIVMIVAIFIDEVEN